MKLVSVAQSKNPEALGLEQGGQIYAFDDLAVAMAAALPSTMAEFLGDVSGNLVRARAAHDWLAGHPNHPASTFSALLSPVPHPTSCRDGYAFRQHVETMRRNRGAEMAPEFDQFPVFYYTNHLAVIGEGPVVVQDDHLAGLDFELELAIVIGKKGRNIRAADADDYILGFTVMNDFSARSLQTEEMKLSLGPAKGKDFATALGPCLVTADEFAGIAKDSPRGKRYPLRMRARHNGHAISDGNAGDMNWTFAQIIERVSYGVDLRPGDVIGSGTVGTGCYAELNSTAARLAKESGRAATPTWLRDGDAIDLEIEGIGILHNKILRVPAPYSIR